MTWARLDPALGRRLDRLEPRGLPDSVARAHFEVLLSLFDLEESSARFYRRQLPQMTNVENPDKAAAHAIRLGVWRFHEDTDEYEIAEQWGGDTIRSSLAAQAKKRADDKAAQQRRRDRASKPNRPASGADVSTDVITGVDNDVAATQTNKQVRRDAENKQHARAPAPAPVSCRLCGRPSTYLDGGVCRRTECTEQRRKKAA